MNWDVNAPERVKTRQVAQIGNFVDTFQKNPPPLSGFETIAPTGMPKKPTDAGTVEYTRFKPPAPSATPGVGFVVAAPEKMRRCPTDPGEGNYWIQGRPSTAANPIGWRIEAPEKMRKRPTDAGGYVQILLALAQPIPPEGWYAIAPEKMKKRPTDHGLAFFTLFAPPAATIANPIGWEPVFPWRMRSAHAAMSFADNPLAATPASTALNRMGWDTSAPWRLPRKRTDIGHFEYGLDRYSAPLIANPIGWEPIFPSRMIVRREPPTAIYGPLTATPGLPIPNAGWLESAPSRLPRRPTDAGIIFYPVRQPDAATGDNPIGWRIEFPDRMARVKLVRGAEYYPSVPEQPTANANPLGWESAADWKFRRRGASAGYVDVPTVIIGPFLAWHEMPSVSFRRHFVSGSGFAETPLIDFPTFEKMGYVLADCVFPVIMPVRMIDAGGYFDVLRAVSNPTVQPVRIQVFGSSALRIEVAGIIEQRRETQGRVVQRKTP